MYHVWRENLTDYWKENHSKQISSSKEILVFCRCCPLCIVGIFDTLCVNIEAVIKSDMIAKYFIYFSIRFNMKHLILTKVLAKYCLVIRLNVFDEPFLLIRFTTYVWSIRKKKPCIECFTIHRHESTFQVLIYKLLSLIRYLFASKTHGREKKFECHTLLPLQVLF